MRKIPLIIGLLSVLPIGYFYFICPVLAGDLFCSIAFLYSLLLILPMGILFAVIINFVQFQIENRKKEDFTSKGLSNTRLFINGFLITIILLIFINEFIGLINIHVLHISNFGYPLSPALSDLIGIQIYENTYFMKISTLGLSFYFLVLGFILTLFISVTSKKKFAIFGSLAAVLLMAPILVFLSVNNVESQWNKDVSWVSERFSQSFESYKYKTNLSSNGNYGFLPRIVDSFFQENQDALCLEINLLMEKDSILENAKRKFSEREAQGRARFQIGKDPYQQIYVLRIIMKNNAPELKKDVDGMVFGCDCDDPNYCVKVVAKGS